MVYTSTSLALACLEYFVHLDASVAPDDLVSISAVIPEDILPEIASVDSLPKDWHRLDHPRLQTLGSEWIRSGRSLALQVPSAVVEGEWNMLISPTHPDFQRIDLGSPKPFRFDARMFKVENQR